MRYVSKRTARYLLCWDDHCSKGLCLTTTPPACPLPLTKGPDQLCPYSCSEGVHQRESGETRKGCIVEEHDVEIAQPVEASKVTQQVKASEP